MRLLHVPALLFCIQTGPDAANLLHQLADMWSATAREVAGGWASLPTELSTPETAAAADPVAGVADTAIYQQMQTEMQQVSKATCGCVCWPWLAVTGVI